MRTSLGGLIFIASALCKRSASIHPILVISQFSGYDIDRVQYFSAVMRSGVREIVLSQRGEQFV